MFYTYIILGLALATLFLTLWIALNQLINRSHQAMTIKAIADSIHELNKQNHLADQQLRESLLVNFNNLEQAILVKLNHSRLEQNQQASDLKEALQHAFANHRTRFDERQMDTLKILQETLQKNAQENRQELKTALNDYGKEMGSRVDQLTQTTATKLAEINQQVEKRLSEGFEKTNETFNDVIKRLALIDAAQRKITELSTNVVSLQEILNDKRSRGAYGEVQLSALIHNMIPESNFSFQHQLSNNRRADCMLFLPEPTGHIAIDAKFPLENYRLLKDKTIPEAEKTQAERQFKLDIRKHIQDISEKYIIPGETADGAVMFIPAEAVFAEIHARHPDLVELSQRLKVWMVSPTTMMAVLTTARAVLKDASTRQQVHEIQKHLRLLSTDFERFQSRMDNLAKHIAQAHSDVEQVHISSRKISQRFTMIDKAEFTTISTEESPLLMNQDLKEESAH
jgi:DNA recombination protein RmuC